MARRNCSSGVSNVARGALIRSDSGRCPTILSRKKITYIKVVRTQLTGGWHILHRAYAKLSAPLQLGLVVILFQIRRPRRCLHQHLVHLPLSVLQ